MAKKCVYKLGILFVLLLFVISCSKLAYKSTYRSMFRGWTAKANVYSIDTLGAKIMWRATYLSPEFRESARKQINQWKELGWDDLGSHPSYLAENDDGSFMVSVYLPPDYPPITAEADSFWELTLNLPSGEAILPSSIEAVKVTPREARLFPYLNQWSTFYRIKFPVSYLEKPFTLTIRSAAVTSNLKWR